MRQLKTDCQKHWEEHYNDYTKEQMQRIIINLLGDVKKREIELDKVARYCEDRYAGECICDVTQKMCAVNI